MNTKLMSACSLLPPRQRKGEMLPNNWWKLKSTYLNLQPSFVVYTAQSGCIHSKVLRCCVIDSIYAFFMSPPATRCGKIAVGTKPLIGTIESDCSDWQAFSATDKQPLWGFTGQKSIVLLFLLNFRWWSWAFRAQSGVVKLLYFFSYVTGTWNRTMKTY